MATMNARYSKQLYLSKTSISAGQVLDKLADNDSTEARSMHRLVGDNEQSVVDRSATYDRWFSMAKVATEQAKQAAGVMSRYIKACLQIALADDITSVTAYASLDRANDSKFVEHLCAVFATRDEFGKALAERLASLRLAADKATSKQLKATEERDRAERELAASVMRLRASIETARSVLHLNGVAVNSRRGARKKKKSTVATGLTAIPQPAAQEATLAA